MSASVNDVVNKAPIKRSPRGLIDRLRMEASANPVFNNVAHMFATRERARRQVTLIGLKARMTREGYSYSDAEYEAVLQFLAHNGIGKLEHDSGGKIKSLNEIKVTLQSIGLAAISKQDVVAPFIPADKLDKLQKVHTVPVMRPKTALYQAELLVNIDGSPVKFQLPALTTESLGNILATLYKMG